MEKILITGTGRCGTTFLIKLFSFLDFDTGYNRENYKENIDSNCNSGMERKYNEDFYILKNPNFMINIGFLLKKKLINIKYVIIPIRDFKESALSRIKNGNADQIGGLLNAHDELSQIEFYKKMFSSYLHAMNKYNINTIFIDFDKMVNDKQYLFDMLKIILDEKDISFETFSDTYDEVSLISKP